MLVVSEPYYTVLKDLGLDPQTFPLTQANREDGWGGEHTFDSDFAKAPLGLWGNFTAITNVGIALSSTMSMPGGHKVNASNTRPATTNINSDTANALLIKVKDNTTSLLTKPNAVDLQTTSFNSNIKSNSSTSIAITSKENTVGVSSDSATDINSVTKATTISKQTDINVSAIQVKEYTVSVIS